MLILIFFTIGIFLLDGVAGLGSSAPILYLGAILLNKILCQCRGIWFLAITCSFFTAGGFFLSSAGETAIFTQIFDRFTAIMFIWWLAFFGKKFGNLLKERRHTALLVEHSRDAILSLTLDGRVTSWNRGAERLYGFSVREMLGRDVSGIIPEDLAGERAGFIEQIREGSIIVNHETKRRNKAGETLEVSVSISPIEDETGEIVEISEISRDISKQNALRQDLAAQRAYAFNMLEGAERAQEELRQAERRIRQIIDAAPIGMVMADQHGKIAMVNSRMEVLFGYPKEELMGESIELLLPPRYRESHPKYRQEYLKNPSPRYMGSGRDLYGQTKQGHEIPLEIGITPIHAKEGNFVLASIIDVTERKKAQEAVNRLASIVNSSQDAIIGKDLNGVITSWNQGAEQLYGYSADEAIGRDLIDLTVHPTLVKQAVEILAKVRSGGHMDSLEICCRRKNKTLFEVAMTVSPITDDAGNVRGTSAIARDITEKKIAENHQAELMRKLQLANRELSDFAHVVSHDLKAPLRGIGMLSQWLEEECADTLHDEGKKRLELIRGRVKLMDSLIDGILTYARISRDQEPDEELDLQAVFDQIVGLLEPPPHIEILPEDELPWLRFPKTHLYQILQNLIGNAIKFSDKPKGEIRVRCDVEDGYAVLRVSDNGSGIDAKYHDKIFQLFESLSSNSQQKSTGVGLALVKRIVERHNGQIKVESAPGVGSSFILSFPKEILIEKTKESECPVS